VPWPLADCLAVARSVDELKHLADLVEQGTIGDADDWRAAEERWTTVGVGRDDFIYRPPGPFSFDASIGSRGLPTYGTGLSINKSSYPNELLLELGSIARELPAGKRCADILWFLCRASAETGGLLTSIDPTGLRALLQQNGLYTAWYENVVGFAEESNLRDRWLEFFDWLGHSDCLDSRYFANNVDGRWARAWEEAFMLNPSKSGLLRVLGRVASIGRTTHIPATRLELASFSEPAGRLAALLLRLTQPALSDKESSDLAAAAAELLEPQVEPGAEMLIFRTVGEHLLTVRALESFLLHLRERIPRRVELGQAKCELLLRRIMRRRSSGLQRPGEPLKLQLPVIMT